MYQILGNLYKKDTTLSKDFSNIKELIRKAFLKEPDEIYIVTENKKEKEIVTIMKDKGYKDCNLFTVLKAIGEVYEEENVNEKVLNVYIKDIKISVDRIPF